MNFKNVPYNATHCNNALHTYIYIPSQIHVLTIRLLFGVCLPPSRPHSQVFCTLYHYHGYHPFILKNALKKSVTATIYSALWNVVVVIVIMYFSTTRMIANMYSFVKDS